MNCIIHCLRFASKQSWKSGLWAKRVRAEFFLLSFSLLCMFENFCNEEGKGKRSLADTGFRQLEGSWGVSIPPVAHLTSRKKVSVYVFLLLYRLFPPLECERQGAGSLFCSLVSPGACHRAWPRGSGRQSLVHAGTSPVGPLRQTELVVWPGVTQPGSDGAGARAPVRPPTPRGSAFSTLHSGCLNLAQEADMRSRVLVFVVVLLCSCPL